MSLSELLFFISHVRILLFHRHVFRLVKPIKVPTLSPRLAIRRHWASLSLQRGACKFICTV